MKNPILFQGKNKKTNYFEGWYFKIVNNLGDRVFAVIPGISLDKEDPHSFIQINDNNGYTNYFRFELDDIKFSKGKKLNFSIKDNHFSEQQIVLNLPNLSVDIKFNNNTKYKGFWPNIMGPFSYIPFMECYHGVVVINSSISGNVVIDNNYTDYNNGKGYIEKDWGSGFPSAWIWLQGNSFREKEVSIMMSFAHIPWLGSFFPGFLGFIHIGDKTHYFSTYNNSKVSKISVKDIIEIELKKRGYRLLIKTKQNNAGVLKAPQNGSMIRSIKESVSSLIEVELYKSNKLIYNGITKAGGLEVVGDIEDLFII